MKASPPFFGKGGGFRHFWFFRVILYNIAIALGLSLLYLFLAFDTRRARSDGKPSSNTIHKYLFFEFLLQFPLIIL